MLVILIIKIFKPSCEYILNKFESVFLFKESDIIINFNEDEVGEDSFYAKKERSRKLKSSCSNATSSSFFIPRVRINYIPPFIASPFTTPEGIEKFRSLCSKVFIPPECEINSLVIEWMHMQNPLKPSFPDKRVFVCFFIIFFFICYYCDYYCYFF
jgi:hypothetical protein